MQYSLFHKTNIINVQTV